MTPSNFDQAREYLARAVPWPQDNEPGFINVHWTKKVDGYAKPLWDGRACRTVEEAARSVAWASGHSDTRDFYLCLSQQRECEDVTSKKGHTYKKALRNQPNAIALKSLFLDLDAKGEDKNSYADLTAAVTALGNFIRAVDLPSPSMMVQSGNGLHVYWTLERALTPAEWLPLSYSLVEAAQRHGLKFDSQCTIDSARVLRIPDTFNFKSDPPKQVKLIGPGRGFDYTIERLARVLEPFKTITPSHPTAVQFADPALFPQRTPVANEMSAGIENTKAPPVMLARLAKGCPFVMEACTTGGKAFANPLWNLTTLIATFTAEGDRSAHIMGHKHPGYTKESTDEQYTRKVGEKASKGLGWPACTTINSSGASVCKACPHLKAGKTPFHFSVPDAPSTAPVSPAGMVVVTPGGAVGVTPGGTPVTTLPASDLPPGYSRNANGWICVAVVDPETGTTEFVPIVNRRMDNPWLQSDPAVLHFTSEVRGKPQNISIELEFVGAMGMRGVLQPQHFMLPVGQRAQENVARFMVGWISKLQETKDSVTSSPFGWTLRNAKLVGFVYANRLWSPGGDTPAASPDTVLARHYAPSGDIGPWTDAAKMITSQGRPALDAILASAFAAPLVRFGNEPGCLMSAYSSESGIGKTTVMKIAQAVWGDPIRAVQSLGDTQNATMNKLGQLRSLPLYWDELKTEEDTKKFVDITFQTSQGKEKARMTQRITQREPGAWQTLLVSASNDSLLDFVTMHTNTTEAGINRIFEYVVPPPVETTQLDHTDAAKIVGKVNDNYGRVGEVYAKYLGENFDQLETAFNVFHKAIGQELGSRAGERFWVLLVASILYGAKLANELGFTEFNLELLKSFMLDEFKGMVRKRAAQPVNMKDVISASTLLNQFMSAMRGHHTLFTNRINTVGRGKPPAGMYKAIGDTTRLDGVYVQMGVEDKIIRISSVQLGIWLKGAGYPRHKIITALEEHGFKVTSGCLGAGLTDARLKSGKESLLELDAQGTPFLSFFEDV